jgi:hypothetical protein
MQKRNPAAVFIFSFITFGIYSIVWSVKTKNEMNKLGSDIPTAWLIIIPFVNYYWYWKYSEGVEKATSGKISAIMAFVLLILLSFVGMAIIQNEFNKTTVVQEVGATAPVNTPDSAPIQPTNFAQSATSAFQTPASEAQPQVVTQVEPTNSQQPPQPPITPQVPPQV